ncbi:MAG: zinc-binding dehydrogenase, partial [Alicyclobacillus sp.]|nr:zinc-binding dehydrogenase [Alicyclobacillus sp.]
YCGECRTCRQGRTNLCEHKQSLGINIPGGFAEEFVIEEKYAIPVPDAIPDRVAVLVEPLAVAVHALKKVPLGAGTSLLVLGCGTEGMLSALLAHARGYEVTVVDVQPEKLSWARSILPEIRTLTPQELGEQGFDVVVEAAGVRATVEQALSLVLPGGTVVVIGLAHDAQLPVQSFVRKEVSLLGSIIYQQVDFYDALRFLEGDPDLLQRLERVIGIEVAAAAFDQAYSYALSGKPGKALLRFE